jgi:large subunit ribosomal protein L1
MAGKKKAEGETKKPKVQKFGHGKKYLDAIKKVDRDNLYSLDEALSLVKETSTTKFDATVELHMQMGVDPKKADQNIRGTVNLPAGTGRVQRVLVLAEDDDAKKAMAAGADFAGLDEMIEKISKGWMDFDVVIATPAVMPKVGKLGQTLGTKGMMPNPKSGTVTAEIEKTVKEFKAGKVEFRVDKDAIMHIGFGKVSFPETDLKTNFNALLNAVKSAKPTTAKGIYMRKATIASTMGPGIKLDIGSL